LQGGSLPNAKFSLVTKCYEDPYWAIGEIKTNLTKGLSIRGTGVLIYPNHVMTVAHNFYNHQH